MTDLFSRHKIHDRPGADSQSWLEENDQSLVGSYNPNPKSQVSELHIAQRPEFNILQGIIQRLVSSKLASQRAYGEDLLVSLNALALVQQT